MIASFSLYLRREFFFWGAELAGKSKRAVEICLAPFPSEKKKMLLILLSLPVLYYVAVIIYRLYLHPLRSIPGPRLAAATGWYDFYYDVYLKGEILFKLKELHETYGPVVRISPREVHVTDLSLYHE